MSYFPLKATIRKEWYELISACRNEADRRQLAFALLERLFEGVAPKLPYPLQPLFSAIEREILLSEKNRRNIEKRWGTAQFGMIPSTIPSTIRRTKPSTKPSTVPSTVPSTIRRTEPAPAHPETAPAHEDNNNTLQENNIKNNKLKENKEDKSSLQKKSPFVAMFSDAFAEDERRTKWEEWEKYYLERNRRRMPATTAHRQIKELMKLTPEQMSKVIDFSIGRGYQGLFYDRALKKPEVILHPAKDYTGV